MSVSEKFNLKFNATIVDSIEKQAGVPIENAVADTSVNSLARILQFSLVDDNKGVAGVSRSVAMQKIDEYTEGGSDRFDLIIDITEALIDAGFLPKTLDATAMRERKAKAVETALESQSEA